VLDLDGDGIISEDELRVAVKSLNKGSDEAECAQAARAHAARGGAQ
jgi:Ca2+-binding EF-hand superfamily protein